VSRLKIVEIKNCQVSEGFEFVSVELEISRKGHNYENQNAKKQPKRTSKISVFLVHHY
jgi:hypothetical protein